MPGSARRSLLRPPPWDAHAKAATSRDLDAQYEGKTAVRQPARDLHRLGDVVDKLLDPLVELEQRVHRASSHYDTGPWQAENFARHLPGKRELSLVATLRGKPVGFVIASRRPEGAHIHRVATDPRHQGTGIASRLLALLLARTPGIVTLICDPRNQPAT